MNFVVIEENKDFREYISELIIKNNDVCHIFEEESNLKLICKAFKPDWLIIGTDLKKQNGFQLAENIKIDNPEISVALLSDLYDARLEEKANQIGADAFITKENLFEIYKIIKGVKVL